MVSPLDDSSKLSGKPFFITNRQVVNNTLYHDKLLTILQLSVESQTLSNAKDLEEEDEEPDMPNEGYIKSVYPPHECYC